MGKDIMQAMEISEYRLHDTTQFLYIMSISVINNMTIAWRMSTIYNNTL